MRPLGSPKIHGGDEVHRIRQVKWKCGDAISRGDFVLRATTLNNVQDVCRCDLRSTTSPAAQILDHFLLPE